MKAGMSPRLSLISHRILFSSLILVLAASCSPSGDQSSKESAQSTTGAKSSEMVTITSGEDQVEAYLSRPAGTPEGVVVVVQEWWGLNDWLINVTDRFAERGYIAIAPNLYRMPAVTDPEKAHELMRGLQEDRAVGDLRSAVEYVNGLRGDDPLPAAIVGFCMGGRLSLMASLDKGPFDATVVCYGRPETSSERLATLPGPLLGIFGADDQGIQEDQIGEFEAGLQASGREFDVVVYDNAGHAFLNDTQPSYAPDAAREAWQRIDKFLIQSLYSVD